MAEYNKEPRLQEELKTLLESKEEKNESSEIKVESSVPEMSESEKKARELGWKSKEERAAEGKSNDYYVEPDEYIRRQPLFQRIEKQNAELRELKELHRKNAENLAKIRKESYDQALREVEARRERAVEEANTAEFKRLDLQHRQVTQAMQNDPMVNQQHIPEISQDLQNFVNRNGSWYNENNPENAKMKAAAEAVDNYLTKAAKMDNQQIDVKAHLEVVEAEVKRLFPHRFQSSVVSKPEPVNTVAKSSAPVKETKSLNNLISRLSPQQRELGESFSKSNPEYTLEKYAADLERMGRLGK